MTIKYDETRGYWVNETQEGTYQIEEGGAMAQREVQLVTNIEDGMSQLLVAKDKIDATIRLMVALGKLDPDTGVITLDSGALDNFPFSQADLQNAVAAYNTAFASLPDALVKTMVQVVKVPA